MSTGEMTIDVDLRFLIHALEIELQPAVGWKLRNVEHCLIPSFARWQISTVVAGSGLAREVKPDAPVVWQAHVAPEEVGDCLGLHIESDAVGEMELPAVVDEASAGAFDCGRHHDSGHDGQWYEKSIHDCKIIIKKSMQEPFNAFFNGILTNVQYYIIDL